MGNISAGSIDAPAVLPYTLAAEINFKLLMYHQQIITMRYMVI